MKWTRKLFGGIGDIVKKGAPILGVVPGVGTALAAGAGALGGALGAVNDKRADGTYKGISGKDALKYGLYGGLGGAGVGALAGGGLAGGGGLKGLAGLKGVGGWKAAGAKGADVLLGKRGGAEAAGAGGGRSGGVFGGIADWIKANPGQAATLGLAGVSAYQGAKQSARNDDYMRQIMALSGEGADEKRALASSARQRLMGGMPARRDLSTMFADPGNPYYRG